MEETKKQFYHEIYEAVRKTLPAEVEILHISLVGDHGKGIASPTSDYDVRVIILNSYDNYLLQRLHQKLTFKTTYDGRNLEGEAYDIYYQVLRVVTNSSPIVLEMLKSEEVYSQSKELIQTLWDISKKCYDPYAHFHTIQGRLRGKLQSYFRDNEETSVKTVPARLAVEVLHSILQLRAIVAGKSLLEFFNMEEVMGFAGDDEQMIRDIIRQASEKEEIELTEKFVDIIKATEKLTTGDIKGYSQDKREELKEIIKEMASVTKETFLNIIKKRYIVK